MAIPSSIQDVPDTLFPLLDTLYHSRLERLQSKQDGEAGIESRLYSCKVLRRKLDQTDIDLREDSIIESYARFVRDLTGHETVAFFADSVQHVQAAEPSSKTGRIVCASALDIEPSFKTRKPPISWTSVDLKLAQDAALDFGLETYITNNEEQLRNLCEKRSDAIFNVRITALAEESSCDISVQYVPHLLGEKDASQLFEALLLYLRESTTDAPGFNAPEKSILNFPPVGRPPVLYQKINGEKTVVDASLPALLQNEFIRRANEYPDRVALDFLCSHASQDAPARHLVITYAKLELITNRLANKIVAIIGPQPENHLSAVPLFLSTSPELYISYLAILKAGSAFCPLPVDAPPQRLQNILEDLQPSLIMGTGALEANLPWINDSKNNTISQPRWINVSQYLPGGAEYQSALTEVSKVTACRQISENDVAYVMYTSGSTGKPKGVQITHLAASCTINAHAITAPIQSFSADIPRWFQFAAPTFDPSLMEIFVTLSSGGTLCAAPRDMSLTNMEATITELRATVMMSTPSMAALLRPDYLPTLRSLWTMGETLLRKVIDNFSSQSSTNSEERSCCVVNAYGPTEAAINCTLLPDFSIHDRGSIIGPALSTCSLFVIDPRSRVPAPVPRGFAGELAIGGPQVSVGYINRPEQNKKAFVDSDEFGRLYRTGDRARVVTDSSGRYVVEFLGRIDSSEVKLSGRRTNLGEIDAVIAPCAGVKDVITISHQRNTDQAGSEEAVAFIVLQETFTENRASVEETCRESCRKQLPSYMCPSRYFFISSIPRSPSGKVDRKILAEMARQMWKSPSSDTSNQTTDSGSRCTFGETSIESLEADASSQLVCRIVSEVVGCKPDSVSSSTNLLSIGIDSLRAVRLLQQFRDAGIQDLSVVDILQSTSLKQLLAIIKDRSEASMAGKPNLKDDSLQRSRTPDLSTSFSDFHHKHHRRCAVELGVADNEIEAILPTTATQSGMLTSFIRSSSARNGPESRKSYIHHSVHKLAASVDLTRFKQSWNNILRQHDIFRTVFLPADDSFSPFLQCILKPEAAKGQLRWHDIPEQKDASSEDAIERILRDVESTITLQRPPFYLGLYQTTDAVYFILSLFHGLFDGASLHLLFEDVEAEYEGRTIGSRTEIDTAVKLHYSGARPETTEYWKQRLETFDSTPFPCLTGVRPELATNSTKVTTTMASVDMNRLKKGARDNMASPLSVLQAAWSLVLLAYKDSMGDVAFGSVVSGRLDMASEVCMAPTFVTIPVLVPSSVINSPNGFSSNSTIAQSISAANADSLRHLQIPLSSLATASGALHYDTLLAFQEFAVSKDQSSLWECVQYPPMGNDFAVMIEIWPETSGMLRLRATYSDTVLDEPSAQLMLKELDEIILFILDHPDKAYYDGRAAATPSHISISDPVSASVVPEELLHTTFEEHALKSPEDLALIFRGNLDLELSVDNVQWTYRELNEKANALAQYLINKFGDLRDKVVPFSLYKSPELYVAILGALKAGAAWCPIDPTFPPQRRHDLIVRADAQMLLVGGKTLLQEHDAVPDYVEMIDLSDLVSRTAPLPEEAIRHPAVQVRTKDMAYLIWTSGTTGLPKGVQIQHHAAARSMRSLRQVIPPSKDSAVRCMQFSQPTFDVFVQDLFYTWGQGGTVISSTKDIMLGSFAKLANATKATHAHLTPAFSSTVQRQECKTLEVITMIGEALPQPVADDWGTNMLAFNTYGPAEVSVVSTLIRFGGPMSHIKSTNVGWCLPSVASYVLTAEGEPIIKGGVGELALAGPQLSRGYWKDPVRSGERFCWNSAVKDTIYLTGDIVRQLHDGTLEFLGRRDDLVKLSGMRVELSEISFALKDCHPSVEQVVTMYLASFKRPKKVVVSFISVPELAQVAPAAQPVMNEKSIAIAETALTTAQKLLPEHMIPSVFIVLGTIPTTASAKIDRALLLKAYEDFDIEAWEHNIAPSESSQWNAKEQTFIDIIADFSGVSGQAISRTSRLPALGIDSIGAVRLASRLNSKGFPVPIIEVIRCHNITDLLALLQRPQSYDSRKSSDKGEILLDFNEKWSDSVASYLGLPKDSLTVIPTLPIQENLLSESFRQYETYWSSHFFDLHDDIEISRLQTAWTLVAQRNEALRASFVLTAALNTTGEADEGRQTFVQVVSDNAIVDWSSDNVSEDEFISKAKQRAQTIAKKHQANLFRTPPWAVSIFNRGAKQTMMLTLHHSLHDGPSLDYIAAELRAAYLETPSHERSQLRDAVADVSLSRCSPEENQTFWEQELKDFVADDDVTGDTPSQDDNTGYISTNVPMSLSITDLRAATQQFGASSVASVIRVAWGCILAEFLECDGKRVVFAEVHSERIIDQALESAIAPLICVSPVPILAHGTVREVMALHNKTAAACWKHRHINPSAIRKMLQRPQHLPLYPAVFVFHPETSEEEPNSDVTLWDEKPDYLGLSVEHNLALNVHQHRDGSISIELAARKNLLSTESVRILARQVDALVTAMIDHPDEQLDELTHYFPRDLISVTTREKIDYDPIVSVENPTCWLEYWAEVHPDWIAAEVAESIEPGEVVSRTWTYRELNSTANRLCDYMHSRGIEKRAIAMCLPRTLLSFAVLAGIFKSGNVYLPLDESLPDDRKLFLLNDSNVRILFSTKTLRPENGEIPEDCEIIDVEDPSFLQDLESCNSADQKIATSPDDNLYLLYTSGSTGAPKGVIITRHNLTAFIECDTIYISKIQPVSLELAGKGKFLCLASRAFDVHLAEVFFAWHWGYSAVTGARSMLLDDLALALKELRVTHAAFVPSLIDQVGLHPDDVPDLRYLSVGGEKISSRTLTTWGNHDRVVLVNAYGPTEVTIGCTAALVSPDTNVRNIGATLGDTVAHVLKPGTLTYVKRGMEGELCLTGSLVGKGYYKRPDAKGFVDDFNGERMYRTGDLVRLMPDDTLEIFGRSDDQTKIRGQRLELGEVSECVRQFATKTGDVATLILKHPELPKPQLVSFFAHTKRLVSPSEKTSVDNKDQTTAMIRAGCKQKLPAYMVPDFVIPLTFFPLAVLSGKADVKQLKAIFATIPLSSLLADGVSNDVEANTTRPLHEQELEIVSILQSVVTGNVSDIRPNTNIFEVGIDSLSAISLATKLRRAGYECTVANILDSPTIEKLSNLPRSEDPAKKEREIAARAQRVLTEVDSNFKSSKISSSIKEKVEQVLPCLPLQEAVVVRSLNNDSSLLYVNHVILKLARNIDLYKLKQAWADSAAANTILRTFFCQVRDNILQAVILQALYSLPWYESQGDVSTASQAWRNEIARDIIGHIQEVPPLRINIFKSETGDRILCLSIHHALYDAESLSMLLKDVSRRYHGEPQQERPSLNSLVAYLQAKDLQQAKTFWTKLLDGYRPAKPAGNATEVESVIVADRALKIKLADLEAGASKLKITLPSLAQTAFGLAMAQAIGINDLIFGLVLSGRSAPIGNIDKLLAPCITTVPQRVDLRKRNATVLDILAMTQTSAGALIEHQHTSLRDIHRWVQADRPLFDCLFSFIKTNGNPIDSSLWTEFTSDMPSDYPFAIEFEAKQDVNELIMHAAYAASFGTAEKVNGLLEMIELLIDKLIGGENPKLEDLNIQPGDDLQARNPDEVDDDHEWTDVETKIKKTLLSIVDVDATHVSRKATFFRLGIDSVISIRFAQRLRQQNLKVSSSDVLRYPCIFELANYLSDKDANTKPTNVAPTQASDIDTSRQNDIEVFEAFNAQDQLETVYDCTPLQTGTLSQTISSDGRLYVHHHAIRLAEDTNLDRLEEAWAQLVRAHDILRTSFHFTKGRANPWLAVVHTNPVIKWTRAQIDPEYIQHTMADLVKRVSYTDAEAFSRPPWQVTILKSITSNILVISMHHSLYDGWSLPLLFQEFADVYLGQPLPPAVPFAQAARLITQTQQQSVDFWLRKLNEYRPIEVPSAPNEAAAFTELTLPLPAADLLNHCKLLNITLQSAMLLAFGKAMCCLVQRRDVTFGQVLSGRSLAMENVETIMGPLFNTLPIRIILDNPLLTNEVAALRLQQDMANGQDYQHAPLGTIQTKWRQAAISNTGALIDSLFVFQKAVDVDTSPSKALWEPFDTDDVKDATEYGLNCEIEQDDKHVTLRASSPAGRLGMERLRAFIQNLSDATIDILKAPSRSVTSFPANLADFPVKMDSKQAIDDIAVEEADHDTIEMIRKALSDISGLPIASISPRTTIYTIGIDSILAIQVASTCRRAGLRLRVADILQGQSPAGIALIVKKNAAKSGTSAKPRSIVLHKETRSRIVDQLRYSEGDVQDIFPCLPGQVYHLAGWLNSGRTFYEPVWPWISKSKLDPYTLQKAWQALQERYPILRTVFVVIDSDQPFQVVLKPSVIAKSSLLVIDTSDEIQAVAEQYLHEEAHQPNDLFTPPIKLTLLRGSSQDAIFLKLHHSIYDPSLMASLIRDLAALYAGTDLKPLPSFSEFASKAHLSSQSSDHKSYWDRTLSDVKPTILETSISPTSTKLRPLAQTFVMMKGVIQNIDSLDELCRSKGISLSALVTVAFSRALAAQTQSANPVTFGFYHAGRSEDLDGIPGPCVNLLPLTVPTHGSAYDITVEIQNTLSSRVNYEQSDLRDLLKRTSHLLPNEPLFNTYLNLLWRNKPTNPQPTEQQIPNNPFENPLFAPLDLGYPTDYASTEPLPGTTAVDTLGTGYLARHNLFCDVAPNWEVNSMDFGIKADAVLMDDKQVKAFVHRIAAEMEGCVADLKA